jgi:hypothetical protein
MKPTLFIERSMVTHAGPVAVAEQGTLGAGKIATGEIGGANPDHGVPNLDIHIRKSIESAGVTMCADKGEFRSAVVLHHVDAKVIGCVPQLDRGGSACGDEQSRGRESSLIDPMEI